MPFSILYSIKDQWITCRGNKEAFVNDRILVVTKAHSVAGSVASVCEEGIFVKVDGIYVDDQNRTNGYGDVFIPYNEIKSIDLMESPKNYESTDKMVSHPDHYQSSNGLEVIDAIEAFTDGLNGIEATDTGNIIKYACRWHKKNGIQDLEKILWYTQHLINHLKKKESNNS